MARVATHLSVSELERHYRAAKEVTAARHYQAIWLLAKGHTVPAVAEMTSFGTRWLEQLLLRDNARGPTALGDQRRHNGRAPAILKPALLERLKPRLATPPANGGLWAGLTVAAWRCPMASASSICCAAVRSCNRPNASGRYSTSPSPTSISKPSSRSTLSSPNAAAPSKPRPTSSKGAPTSTGGPKPAARTDQPDLA